MRFINGSTGIITRLAGTGTTGSTGDLGAATAATLNSPRDVAYDPEDGSVYITGVSCCPGLVLAFFTCRTMLEWDRHMCMLHAATSSSLRLH